MLNEYLAIKTIDELEDWTKSGVQIYANRPEGLEPIESNEILHQEFIKVSNLVGCLYYWIKAED